jgi:hypothetical protein
MLFAISRGSDGSGAERYVVYVPFTLAPGASLGALERPAVSSGPGYQLTLEKLQYLYALSLGPFASLEEASSYIGKARASLLWLSLKFNCGVSYPKALSDVNLLDQPISHPRTGTTAELASAWGWSATDGHYDADQAVVRPDHKRLMRWEMGQVSVTVGISIDNFLTSIHQAFSFPSLEQVIEDAKLKLAIEVYAAYRFELSENAQLITLVTALEALLPDTDIPTHAHAALLRGKEAIGAARDAHSKDSPEWREVNHLLSRLGNLQREAIGTGLCKYASNVASRHAELGNAQDNAEKLQVAYDVRSTLLHKGRATDVSQSLGFLREFVPRLLEALYREVAGVTQP